MRIVNEVELATIQAHLCRLKTGVMLDRHDLPSLDDGRWRGYKVLLDSADLDRVFLWWQNEVYTRNRTCRVIDLLPSASALGKVQSFIVGSVSHGLFPLDLRAADGMELCVVSNSLDDAFLYVIDGNHRLIAHWLQGRHLENVPAYLAVHDDLSTWVYLPDYLRKQLRL